jgi:tetratricopeptide (TPR) repeat protein
MGGIGKTQIAAEYAYRHGGDYDLIGWINADRGDLIPDQLAALAPMLGVAVAPGARSGTVANAVQAALAETSRRWLLVFDNALDRKAITAYLPRGGRGQVIVTTRVRGWDGVGPIIEIDVLRRSAAITLLRASLSTVDSATSDALCAELGDLPLAVELAGRYLAASGAAPDGYLPRLRTRAEQLLAAGHGALPAHTVATVWDLTRHELVTSGPAGEAAVALLEVCAFLGSDPVPLCLFGDHAMLLPAPAARAAADPGRFAQALAAIFEYGLATASATGGIVVHRLLATVIRAHVRGSSEAEPGPQRTALALLRAAIPDEFLIDSAHWPMVADLVAHVCAAVARLPVDHKDVAALYLDDRAASYLQGQGQLGPAISLLERGLTDSRRVLGSNHPDCLTAENHLASAYRLAGRVGEAIALFEHVANHRRRSLGERHPDTLAAGHDLAQAYDGAGHLRAAIGVYERVVAQQERAMGDDHPNTLMSRNCLAAAYALAGRVAEAVTLYEGVVADCRRVLGDDHTHTLMSRQRLARAYQAADRLDEAMALDRRLIDDRQRVLGADHPDTLSSRHNLAVDYTQSGQTGEAAGLLKPLLADCERALGADHPLTTQVRSGLAALNARRVRA